MPGADPNILIQIAALFTEGTETPRPLEEAAIALERLGWLGDPVVLAGERLGGRALPNEEGARCDWIRSQLARPDLQVVPFEDGTGGSRPGDASDRDATRRWRQVGASWSAGYLITRDPSSVGPARRAGLVVTRIGPRAKDADPTLPRADHEAIDLLDAVRQLIAGDAFGGPRDPSATA